MPLEILLMIITLIPDQMVPYTMESFRRVWHIDVHDTAMLLPISLTCRRLRAVTLGCPSLWTSIPYGPRPQLRLFVQRSQGLALKTFLSNPMPWEDQKLPENAEELLTTVRELDLGDLHIWSIPLEPLFSRPMHNLETLSIHFVEDAQPEDADETGQYLFEVPLIQEHLPRLRRLYLGACDIASYNILSSLTHLALHVIIIPHVHHVLESVLQACHALESLHLEEVEDQQDLLHPTEYRLLPRPPVLATTCRRLRRVALSLLYNRLASFVLSLILADQQPLVVQLHTIYADTSQPTIHQHRILDLDAKPSLVTIGRYPQPHNFVKESPLVWGMTASGSQRTLRVVGDTLQEATDPLHEGGAAMIADVHELWLADVSPATCDEPNTLPASDAAALRALIKSMTALETVTLVNQFQAPWTGAPPSLGLLPDGREDGPHTSRPSKVRIAYGYGYGKHVLQRWTERPDPPHVVPPLDLTGILDEVSSGAYNYIRHLVLETPSRVDVNAEDVERLRTHFETVQVRVVDETPTIALPPYCVEPAAWPHDAPWPYRLW